MSRSLLLATALAATAGFAALASAQDGSEGVTKDTITLGTSTPLTGPVAPTCKPINEGAQAWFDQINKNGGVHGRKINNIVLDDAYKAPEALANARELLGKVFAMFGGCGTIQPAAIMPLAQRAKIPYAFPFAGNPELSTAPYTFTLLPTYASQFESLVYTLIKKDGGGKVYTVLADVSGVALAVEGLKNAALKGGGEFVGSDVVNPTETDYTPVVLKIKASGADYVAINLNGGASARLVRAMAANNGYPTKFVVGGPANATVSFIEPAGDAADGKVLATLPIVPDSNPRAKSCVDAVKARDPSLPTDFSTLWGCATAQVMVTAIDKAGPNLTREALVKEMESWKDVQASPLFPPLTFDAKKRLGLSDMYYVAVQNGSIVVSGQFDLLP